MKPFILLFLLIISSANAWIIDGLGEFKPEKISQNVFVIHGPLQDPNRENQGFMNNPGIIIGADGIILIDPGSSYQVGKNVIKAIKSISKKPIKAVFNTHIHGDHWLGNQAVIDDFPTAKIYAHPQMIKSAKEGEGERWVKLMEKLTEGFSKGSKAVYPTNATKHLQVIKIGSETFKIHNPTAKAHTNTDIMIEHSNSKTLFLGDNDVFQRMVRFDDSASIHGNIKALDYAINLGLDYYVPGHGKTGNAKAVVKPFLDYLEIIKAQTQKGYENDLVDYEIKAIAIKKLGAYQNWSNFSNSVGIHISKMLLEIEALDL